MATDKNVRRWRYVFPDKSELEALVYEKKLSDVAIAKLYECHSNTVKNARQRFGIERRSAKGDAA